MCSLVQTWLKTRNMGVLVLLKYWANHSSFLLIASINSELSFALKNFSWLQVSLLLVLLLLSNFFHPLNFPWTYSDIALRYIIFIALMWYSNFQISSICVYILAVTHKLQMMNWKTWYLHDRNSLHNQSIKRQIFHFISEFDSSWYFNLLRCICIDNYIVSTPFYKDYVE